MKKAIKGIFNTVIDILVVLVLIISILTVILSLSSKSAGVANIFGYVPLSVQSGSMEPTFYQNDLIFCKHIEDKAYSYKVDDIVTFPMEVDGVRILNTHRIIEVIEDNGTVFYRTKGDNNQTNYEADRKLITSDDIVALYTGKRIGGFGKAFTFLRTQLGFFLCILLPMIIFFVYELIRVIVNFMAYNKEKAVEQALQTVSSSELTEEQKQRAIAEYLAQQKIKEEAAAEKQKPDDGKPDEAKDKKQEKSPRQGEEPVADEEEE